MLVLLVAALLSTDPPDDAEARASALRAAARAALGGEPALAPVRALSLQGHFHRLPPPDGGPPDAAARPPRGPFNREAEGDLEVELALPDKMRVESSVSRAGSPSFTMIMGLSGTQAFMGTEGAPGFGAGFGRGGPRAENDSAGATGRGPTPEERRAALGRRMQGELERMRLGLFADAGAAASMTYAGQAESPDGHADVLDVVTASGEKSRLFLDATSHLPLMVTYQDTLPARRFRRPPAAEGAPPPDAAPSPAPSPAAPRSVEGTLFLSDHRVVNGVQLPFRISRAVEGRIVDEWEITRWRVNPSLKPERFEKQ